MNLRKGLWLMLIFMTACTTAVDLSPDTPAAVPAIGTITEAESAAPANIPENPTTNRRTVTDEVYSFSSLIPYDGIRPIYDPVFVSAEDAPYQDDELVMGLAWGGEAKA